MTEAAEDPARDERLRAELHPVADVLVEGEAEADRRSVHYAVHNPANSIRPRLSNAARKAMTKMMRSEPLGGLLDHGGHEDRGERVRLPFAHQRSEVVLARVLKKTAMVVATAKPQRKTATT